jgi:DNA (cytosine-5)-methyltransferase 1
MRVAGLFAGIGGLELGLDGEPVLFAENFGPAQRVLAEHFPGVPVVSDVRDLDTLPDCDVVTAGFPCQDLSPAGRKQGLGGRQSSLVSEVFRLLERRPVPVVLLENVMNMLMLDGGRTMAYVTGSLEALGYRWAYRTVDSRTTGVPQRRRRVYLLASTDIDPARVLFADEAVPVLLHQPYRTAAWDWFGGRRGCAFVWDSTPTIMTKPAIAVWARDEPPGRQVLALQDPEQLERLQGFPPGWTAVAGSVTNRCRLIGNAVTVDVVRWVGRRLRDPGRPEKQETPVERSAFTRWPSAARGEWGRTWAVQASHWPVSSAWTPLDEFIDLERLAPLSSRATAGFLRRVRTFKPKLPPGLLTVLEQHVSYHGGNL